MPIGVTDEEQPEQLATTASATAEIATDPSSTAKEAPPAQIDKWIAELSDDSFAVRQSAANKLLNAGLHVRKPLLEIAEGPDPESRAAARRLIALIDKDEFRRRLDAFAADTQDKLGLTLPGWEQFQETVGTDEAARALFVEMQRHEGPLLESVFANRAPLKDQQWEDRLLRIARWPGVVGDQATSLPLGSCAAMLFISSAPDLPISDRGAMLVEGLIQRTPLREALAASRPDEPIRRLIGGWILHCPNKNESILARRLNLASTINLKEVLPLAFAVAGGDPQHTSVSPSTQAFAVLVIGQLGGPEHLDQLEPLLEDNTVCMPIQAQIPGQPPASVQIRDVTLVALLQLTGQRPAEYGYVHARMQPQQLFQLQTLHRETDEQRVAAIAKWRTWRAAEKRRTEN